MPINFRAARLWILIGLVILAVAAANATRAVQIDGATLPIWPHSAAM